MPNFLPKQYIGPLSISIVVAIIGYLAVLLWSGSELTVGAIASIDPSIWLLLVLLSFANYVARFVRWNYYIAQTSAVRIPTATHFLIYLSGFSLTTTPGKAGEVLRSVYLKKHGVSYPDSIGIFFTERFVDLLAIVLMAGLFVTGFDDPELSIATVFAVCLIVLLLPFVHRRAFWMNLGQMVGFISDRLKNVVIHLSTVMGVASTLLRFRSLAPWLVFSILAWSLEGIGLYWTLDSIGIECSVLLAVGIYAVAVSAGALSFLPGGLGSTEATMGLLLVGIGADTHLAVAATLVCRLVTLWLAVVLGFVAVVVLAYLREPDDE